MPRRRERPRLRVREIHHVGVIVAPIAGSRFALHVRSVWGAAQGPARFRCRALVRWRQMSSRALPNSWTILRAHPLHRPRAHAVEERHHEHHAPTRQRTILVRLLPGIRVLHRMRSHRRRPHDPHLVDRSQPHTGLGRADDLGRNARSRRHAATARQDAHGLPWRVAMLELRPIVRVGDSIRARSRAGDSPGCARGLSARTRHFPVVDPRGASLRDVAHGATSGTLK